MFGDSRWGEPVAGAREGFLFFFVRMLPSWHGRVEGGCWRAQMMTNEAAGLFVLHTDTLHWGSPGDAVSRQLAQTLMLLLALALQWKWETLPLVTQGCTDDTAVTRLQWKCDDFSLWLMYRPMASQSWTAGDQIALHAFEMEDTILQLSACIGQMWM